MSVSRTNLVAAVRHAGLSGRAVCIHCSLRSFGYVEGGARSLVDAFLQEGSTLLAPTFSWTYSSPPPPGDRPSQNGTRYDVADREMPEQIFNPAVTAVDRDMGAVSAAVVNASGRVRGCHPICSFSALGPLANDLIASQRPLAVWAPLERLVALDGAVALIGVDLTRLTLAHLAEQLAGRRPFLRWARSPQGNVVRVRVGGCSDGFAGFESVLREVAGEYVVGESTWTVLRAKLAVELMTHAISECPDITRCFDPSCERCQDAVAGGPLD